MSHVICEMLFVAIIVGGAVICLPSFLLDLGGMFVKFPGE